MAFVPNVGADGLAIDVPIITYTEKVLEEKELKLKQYIQHNYSKIRDVEKELATLALEVKLTAGPKKLALEHLRKKIEVATEKVKAAKLKEEQTRKVWQAAEKALLAEEAYKKSLCDDLNRLVQESAAAQYTRLNDLAQRLEDLNPNLKGSASQALALDDVNAKQAAQQPDVDSKQQSSSKYRQAESVSEDRMSHPTEDENGKSNDAAAGVPAYDAPDKRARAQHVTLGKGRGRLVGGRGKDFLGLQRTSKANGSGGWTGAGFDVDDVQ